MRRLPILILCALPVFAHAAPARLTQAGVRAFAARQERAWNASDAAGFFGLFTPDARFTDQARAKDGRVVPYGTSTLAQARAQATSFFARSRHHETSTIRSVRIAPDGRSAVVLGDEVAEIATAGRTRRSCAETEQTIVLTPAGLRSKGQTDTQVACR
ncbi:MAG TPA: nuclear transport factor 2 family protein [Phenylobacterium sp.]|uniref:nuclear transport factor 2 family protein n=1 Tax=Phenylobacterium sp. TaxID=1871053 RepID=UPI002D1086B9|nr:nuclear transport factor 2 family protein [Phenylobacterium sp.]HSV02970.1 nuclear transport factor 2 family protein [Phenylobacterium sp.]